ncbi:LPD1 domain-containing protein [Pseudomonas lurida]|uniref:LPD1 domain-containing protein n=1 Tax=Pseudomonas lurida TaxID=244566 RepID=UPI001784A565|nr:LPD1 domain-containing protein [Pseudomonas lurida]MBD8671636.1 hypothetical protein [Pseudomonas lurida]
MALTPIETARLSARLLQLREQLQSGTLHNIQAVRATTEALDIYAKLGGDTAGAPATQNDAQAADLDAPDDGLSDDPNSDNYRYKDTGYISGSRKEQAANTIKLARESGQMLRSSDIDFKAVEENPRQARELIKKSNLFGQVDWADLKTAGMPPEVGYLIDRVYASIAPMPAEDTPQSRKSYALGIETIRTRLEGAKSVEEVTSVITEISDELTGVRLNSEESGRFADIGTQLRELAARAQVIDKAKDALYQASNAAQSALWKAQNDFENRLKRGWKVEPKHEEAVTEAKALAASTSKAWADELAATKEERESIRAQRVALAGEQRTITDIARARNQKSPEAQAWMSLGERFIKATMYRKLRGSDTFAGHVANARAGEPKTWDWAEKEKAPPVKRASQRRITFALKVVENFERKGGRPVAIASTADLERLCNFRAVQSGNWVLEDFASAKWHVEQSAGAMMDMADMLGIDESVLGFGGRLSVAFGARGVGGKGAARAHYEPIERAINITKMNGGGSFGHEVYHALDNILPSLLRGAEGAKDEWASHTPELMPEGAIRTAFAKLKLALTSGTERLTETIKLAPNSRETAIYNLDGARVLRGVALAVKQAGNLDDAVLAVDKAFQGQTLPRSLKQKKQWRQIAAAYYSPEGATEAVAKSGTTVSNFYLEAQKLDDGKTGKYWSEFHEMAARAFQSYLEDKLAESGRQNDYLSCLADNKYHYLPELGTPFKPYPEGEERAHINKAFDQVFKTLREEKAFENAMNNTALLDSIFGVFHD